MTARRAGVPAHPFLVAIVPVWSLWSSNADQVDPRIPLLASLAALALCTALLVVARGGVRDWQRAGLLTSLWLVLFFSYGYLCDAWSVGPAAAFSATLAVGGSLWLARTRFALANWAAVVSAGALALLAYSVLQLGLAAVAAGRSAEVTEAVLAGPGVEAGPRIDPIREEDPSRPDIYYLVLDGYAGQEVLRDVFDTDNSGFLNGLRERGFYIAERSAANYAMTHLSLSSVLNAGYLDALTRELDEGELSFEAPYALLRKHWVGRFLRARGYRYLQLFTNWGGTERSEIADLGYAYVPYWLRSEFTGVLLRATPLRALAPNVAGFHRFGFEAIRKVPGIEGPTFLFAHLLVPHEPYVFDREGQVRADIPLHLRANLFEKEKAAAGRGDAAYADQLHFVNGEVTRLVDDLLAASPTPPIIIIQGDHGWASHSAEPRSPEFVRARFPILNAFYVPEAARARLYPTISSVNTFRVLLAELFGAELPLLPDRHLLSWYDAPYRFRDVSDQLRSAEPKTP